jgi:hypothetical protein
MYGSNENIRFLLYPVVSFTIANRSKSSINRNAVVMFTSRTDATHWLAVIGCPEMFAWLKNVFNPASLLSIPD